MAIKGQNLAESVANRIAAMIGTEHRFAVGEKIPNEIALSRELSVSRTTLREAIRILSAHGILDVQRGRGTFVLRNRELSGNYSLKELEAIRPDLKDLFEMRLIFEPQAAYYAAKRATEHELEQILSYGNLEEKKILNREDRTEVDRAFHKSIAKATHNEFMSRLIPILYQAIGTGVMLSNTNGTILHDTLTDHHLIMDFLSHRDAEGAKTAMKLHLLHAMREFGIAED